MSCTRTTRRAYTSYECNANTSRARRHQERRGTGPHHTMVEAHTACLPQLRRGGTLRKQQRWFEQAARSSFEFFFFKKGNAVRTYGKNQPQRTDRQEPTSRGHLHRKYVRTLIFSMHVRDTNDDGPTDTTRAHNTSTLVLVVRHRDTTLPRAGTHTHHATPPPRHTTDTRARTTQDPSDARMRGSHSPHLMSAFSSSSQSPAQTHAPSPAARARTHARTGTHTPTHDTRPIHTTHTQTKFC